MRKLFISRGPVWVIATLAVLSIAAAMGLGRVEPRGRDAGLIRFDVISESCLDWSGATNIVMFARYWVCADYYAVSVLWTEPHGGGRDLRSLRILSDETGFRMKDEHQSFWDPTNTTYPKPVGERPAFCWSGGMYETAEMRYAEADALARRVYCSDLVSVRDRDGTFEVDVPQDASGAARKLAHLKVQAKDNRIDSMELFDGEQRSLARMEYTYEREGGPARLAALTAELPVRPEKVGGGSRVTVAPDGQTTTRTVPHADYVSHKGGRTCTVTYEDVALGEQVLRLPVRIRVQRTDNEQLVRSARLMNFKRVELDKNEVWQATEAFGELGPMYATWERLMKKFPWHTPDLGPLSVDPNDPAVVRRLTAKYPVWDPPAAPPPEPRMKGRPKTPPTDLEGQMEESRARERERMQQRIEEQERLKEFRRRLSQMPRPPRKDIEPNDARLIRQLHAHYRKLPSGLTKEQKAVPKPDRPMVGLSYTLGQRGRQILDLRDQLREILHYHRAPTLPEDRPPEPNESDLKVMAELKTHYEKPALQRDRGVGGRLKAINLLTWLDRTVKDFDAFESHVVRYLRMLDDAELNEMYLVGGCRYISTLIESGQYDSASRLVSRWAERSAAANRPDAVYRFCHSVVGGKGYPWLGAQVLDRLLKKRDLSPLERYEGLALRAIALDRIDKLLADPKTREDASRRARAQWILKNARRTEVSRMLKAALREAVAAWEALGPARLTVAKPYSTTNMPENPRKLWGYPEATTLQETSARLMRLIQQRSSKAKTGRSGPRRGPLHHRPLREDRRRN